MFRQLGPAACALARGMAPGGVRRRPRPGGSALQSRYRKSQFEAYTHALPRRGHDVARDGLHWTRDPKPICDVFADSQYSGFWDDSIGQYVLYGRCSGRRPVDWTFDESDLSTGSMPPTLVLQSGRVGDARPRPLQPARALRYPYADRVYFMFPSVFRHSTGHARYSFGGQSRRRTLVVARMGQALCSVGRSGQCRWRIVVYGGKDSPALATRSGSTTRGSALKTQRGRARTIVEARKPPGDQPNR